MRAPAPKHEAVISTAFGSRAICAIAQAALAFAACGWSALVLAAEPRRPNVVLIVCDDLNCALGAYGHPIVRTPHIDALAAHGVRFDRAYCQYPLCNPSRSSLLSGLYPTTTRIVDNRVRPQERIEGIAYLPAWFAENGYRTVGLGKIFHTGNGFTDPVTWDDRLTEGLPAKNPPPEQIERRQGEGGIVLSVDDAATWDGTLARRAAQVLEAPGDKPLFLALGFRRPHTPYIAPRRYFELYPPESIPLVDEPAEHLAHIPLLARRLASIPDLSPEQARATTAAYFASISFLDAQVGVVTAALDRRGLWGNTVVVLLGDHGYHLGEHGGLRHKMTLFEEACRVPLVVVAPGIGSRATNRLAELVDLYPTLCELCNLPAPAHLQGRSTVDVLANPQAPGKQAAYTVLSRSGNGQGGDLLDPDYLGRSVRTARYRLTRWPDGTAELYDHEVDPHEWNNVVARPESAAIVADLDALLASLPGAQKAAKAETPSP